MSGGVPSRLERTSRWAWWVAAAGAAGCAAGLAAAPERFFEAYLFAFVFWTGLSLGCLGFLMIWYLAGGRWGSVLRYPLEAGSVTLLPMALLFLPLVAGLERLYPWARPEVVAADELLQHKSAYLNVPFFLVRAGVYFAAWITLALVLWRWRGERRGDEARSSSRMQRLSAGGLLVVGVTGTFATVDWVMSLQPHWYSTVFGFMMLAGFVLGGLALGVVAVLMLEGEEPLRGMVATTQLHDMGNFLLAFVMFWTYVAFVQFLIIWYGDLPEEVGWLVERMSPGWRMVGLGVLVLHFFVPFLLLLFKRVKTDRRLLLGVALGLVVMRVVHDYWLMAPAFHRQGLPLHWADPAALAAVGGVWVAGAARHLAGRIPLGSPPVGAAEQDHG